MNLATIFDRHPDDAVALISRGKTSRMVPLAKLSGVIGRGCSHSGLCRVIESPLCAAITRISSRPTWQFLARGALQFP